jgi:predicted PurR-regulated permease PerM
MMEKKKIEDVFRELQGTFDTGEPAEGHAQRFLAKLQATSKVVSLEKKPKRNWWRPLSIAASVALFLAVAGAYLLAPSVEDQVAEISPEVSKTEFYFANLINDQVKQMQGESTPETKKIIEDTMVQLQNLEQDYKTMEQDLLNGGNSKLILRAMITNFQTRMDLLQEVLNKIETIKTLKNYTHEDNNTI